MTHDKGQKEPSAECLTTALLYLVYNTNSIQQYKHKSM